MRALAIAGVVFFCVTSVAVARVALPEGRSSALPRDKVLACRTAGSVRQVTLFLSQGDKLAATKQLSVFLSKGICLQLAQGDIVFVVKSDESDEIIAIRKKGDIDTLHILITELMTDEEIGVWSKARFGDIRVGRLGRFCVLLPKAPLCTSYYYNP